MNSPREDHACISITDASGNANKIVVAGGYGSGLLSTTEIYDVKEGKWQNGPNLIVPVYRSSLVAAPASSNYAAYLVGGWTGSTARNEIQAISKELDQWVHVGNLATERFWHTALQIPPGLIEGCSNHE